MIEIKNGAVIVTKDVQLRTKSHDEKPSVVLRTVHKVNNEPENDSLPTKNVVNSHLNGNNCSFSVFENEIKKEESNVSQNRGLFPPMEFNSDRLKEEDLITEDTIKSLQ